jgi:hypothetical protein
MAASSPIPRRTRLARSGCSCGSDGGSVTTGGARRLWLAIAHVDHVFCVETSSRMVFARRGDRIGTHICAYTHNSGLPRLRAVVGAYGPDGPGRRSLHAGSVNRMVQ